jgi:hypothetical protein
VPTLIFFLQLIRSKCLQSFEIGFGHLKMLPRRKLGEVITLANWGQKGVTCSLRVDLTTKLCAHFAMARVFRRLSILPKRLILKAAERVLVVTKGN